VRKELISLPQAARSLGVNWKTLLSRFDAKGVPFLKEHNTYVVKYEDFQRFIERNTVKRAGAEQKRTRQG
jgi:hypothetical protein